MLYLYLFCGKPRKQSLEAHLAKLAPTYGVPLKVEAVDILRKPFLPICQIFRHKTLFLNGFGMDLILLWSLALRAQLSAGPPGGTVEGHDRSGPTSTLMACQVCAGRNDARHDWATSWPIFPCGLRRLLWTCRALLFCLSSQRTSVRWRRGADLPLCGSNPSSVTSWTTRALSMWSFIRLTLALLTRSGHVSC